MEEERNSRMPSNNPIKQQRLKGYQPVHTLQSTILILLVIGVLFFIFGVALYLEADKAIEITQRYDDLPDCQVSLDNSTTCQVALDIKFDMKKPVFLYYQMKYFYQNYRTYVKSKSWPQLRGDHIDSTKLKDCDPVEYVKDLNVHNNLNGETLDPDAVANPCGLIAKSFFNDTYALYNANAENIAIRETGIALESDFETFINNGNYKDKQWIDKEDEHFINWMKISSMRKFWKLWGVVDQDIKAGQYVVEITNNYDVSKWGGEKAVVLTTVNALGAKNFFLGSVFLCAGILCCVATVFFCSMGVMSEKRIIEGDHLKWK